MEESLGKLRIEEGERHDAESESAEESAKRGTEVRDIFSKRKKHNMMIKQNLRVRAQRRVQREAQRCAIY